MPQLIVALSVVLSMASGALLAREQSTRTANPRNRDVYVSVVTGSGQPVAGLTAKDFAVREDGVLREVVSAGPATEPLTISVLVDDSQAATDAIQFIRDALGAFVNRLSGKAEIAIATFGERPISVVDFTTSADALKRGVTKIFARSGSGAYLLDALIDVSRGLEKREAKRPHIVVITTAGTEFSNRSYQQVLDALQASRASLHVLALGQPSSSTDDEMRQRNIALGEGTERTGGRYDQVLALSGLTDRMQQLADELTGQYLVTYGSPDQLIPPEKIQVTVSRPGVTVRARTRVAGR